MALFNKQRGILNMTLGGIDYRMSIMNEAIATWETKTGKNFLETGLKIAGASLAAAKGAGYAGIIKVTNVNDMVDMFHCCAAANGNTCTRIQIYDDVTKDGYIEQIANYIQLVTFAMNGGNHRDDEDADEGQDAGKNSAEK